MVRCNDINIIIRGVPTCPHKPGLPLVQAAPNRAFWSFVGQWHGLSPGTAALRNMVVECRTKRSGDVRYCKMMSDDIRWCTDDVQMMYRWCNPKNNTGRIGLLLRWIVSRIHQDFPGIRWILRDDQTIMVRWHSTEGATTTAVSAGISKNPLIPWKFRCKGCLHLLTEMLPARQALEPGVLPREIRSGHPAGTNQSPTTPPVVTRCYNFIQFLSDPAIASAFNVWT